MQNDALAQIQQHYYNVGMQAALEKTALDMSEIQEAMELQRALQRGSAADRIGSTIEQRRREGAIAGTGLGALMGLAGGAASGGSAGAKILKALAAAGVGGLAGNVVGRGLGLGTGAIEGGVSAIPGVRNIGDALASPIDV